MARWTVPARSVRLAAVVVVRGSARGHQAAPAAATGFRHRSAVSAGEVDAVTTGDEMAAAGQVGLEEAEELLPLDHARAASRATATAPRATTESATATATGAITAITAITATVIATAATTATADGVEGTRTSGTGVAGGGVRIRVGGVESVAVVPPAALVAAVRLQVEEAEQGFPSSDALLLRMDEGVGVGVAVVRMTGRVRGGDRRRNVHG